MYKFDSLSKKQLMIVDVLGFAVFFFLLAIFRPDIVVIFGYVFLYVYLFLTGRKLFLPALYVSSGVAFVWVLIAHAQYAYGKGMFSFFGITVYPFFAWADGLFLGYMVYSYCEYKFKPVSWIKKLLIFVAFYWPVLFFIETVAYHVFYFRNLATLAYPGLPICDCIHAPRWMQAAYLLIGPIYFFICKSLGLKNPYEKIKRK